MAGSAIPGAGYGEHDPHGAGAAAQERLVASATPVVLTADDFVIV